MESANYPKGKPNELSNSKIRESTKLRLRKENMNTQAMNHHLNIIRGSIIFHSDYEINTNSLQVSPAFIAEFTASTTKPNVALNNLSNDSLDIIKYCLRFLYDYFNNLNENIKDSLDRLILPKTLNEILGLLIRYANTDNQILYTITRLLIVFSIHSQSLRLQIASQQIIIGLFNILTQEKVDYGIMNNILCLYGNWLSDSALFDSITKGCNITPYIFKYIEEADRYKVSHSIVENSLLIICNLVNRESYPLLKSNLQRALNYIIKYIITDLNQNLFSMALNTLEKIFEYAEVNDFLTLQDDISYTIIFVEHIKPFTSIKEKDILYKTLEILINVTYLSDSALRKIVLEDELLPRLDLLFDTIKSDLFNYKELLPKILDLLINLCSIHKTADKLIRKSLILKNLIDLLHMDLNKDEYNAIMMIFDSVTNTGQLISNHYMEMIYLDLPKNVIMYTLTSKKDEKSMILSLTMAQLFLEYGKDLIQGQNIIRRYYEKIGLDAIIESLSACVSKSLSELAQKITEEYFKA